MTDSKKHERFVKVAEARTNKALDAISYIGNCADMRMYEYTPEEVEKIFTALEQTIAKTRERFCNGSGRKTVFRLCEEEGGDTE